VDETVDQPDNAAGKKTGKATSKAEGKVTGETAEKAIGKATDKATSAPTDKKPLALDWKDQRLLIQKARNSTGLFDVINRLRLENRSLARVL
jgi:hypothetical protein